MRPTQPMLLRLAAAAAGLSLMAGCATPPNRPLVSGEPRYTASNPPPFLNTGEGIAGDGTWKELARSKVRPGETKTVGGGRYELRFHPGSLAQETEITIEEQSPSVLQLQLGPHGTHFGTPVELTIDFAGTNADPGSSRYDGSQPEFYWFNDETGVWEVVPGARVPGSQKYTIRLKHFSVYGLVSTIISGKAGW